MNNLRTGVLMAGLIALLMAAGQLVGGTSGLLLGSILGLGANVFMFLFSDRLVLRMYGAHVVTEAEAPELYLVVDRLRQRAEIPAACRNFAGAEHRRRYAQG